MSSEEHKWSPFDNPSQIDPEILKSFRDEAIIKCNEEREKFLAIYFNKLYEEIKNRIQELTNE